MWAVQTKSIEETKPFSIKHFLFLLTVVVVVMSSTLNIRGLIRDSLSVAYKIPDMDEEWKSIWRTRHFAVVAELNTELDFIRKRYKEDHRLTDLRTGREWLELQLKYLLLHAKHSGLYKNPEDRTEFKQLKLDIGKLAIYTDCETRRTQRVVTANDITHMFEIIDSECGE